MDLLEQVFEFSPDEFEFHEPVLRWSPPCFIDVDLYLAPKSTRAVSQFRWNIRVPHCVDLFAAKTSLNDQLWQAHCDKYKYIKDPRSCWYQTLWQQFQVLRKKLESAATVFGPTFKFVVRKDFRKASLEDVLKQDPDNSEVYLMYEERDRYSKYTYLRVHSMPLADATNLLWFEKRLPRRIQNEDVVPWFRATILRLPKKAQPSNIDAWVAKLSESHDSLSVQKPGSAWNEKPKIILVFGAAERVGYRGLFHLERPGVRRIIRQHNVLVLMAEPNDFSVYSKGEIWTFYLVTSDEAAAARVETQMVTGKRIHFGLDVDVVGMIAHHEGAVHTINVEESEMRRLCGLADIKLHLESQPQEKHKLYFYEAKCD